MKIPERHQWRFDFFHVNFEHIFTPSSSVFIFNFEQVNADLNVLVSDHAARSQT